MILNMKTLLIGNFGGGNVGDELILNSALEEKGIDDVVVMSCDGEKSRAFCEREFEVVRFFPVGLRSFFKFLFSRSYQREIFGLRSRIDKVVFSGGGLFAMKFRAVLLWFFVFLWVRVLFKKDVDVVFEGQGIDLEGGGKWFLKYVFSRASSVTVRDKASAKVLKDLGVEGVKVGEDRVVSFLQKQTLWDATVKPKKVILINAISDVDRDFWDKFLLKYDGYRKVFVAFEEGDLRFCPAELERDSVFPRSKTELFTLFEMAELAVGERFHFLVLGEYFCDAEYTFTLREPYAEKVLSFVGENSILVISNQ